jgi:gamma-glutamylcyclotransferase (GGCT)/AIG2-like uncharacterized protein YtfP
MLALPITLAGSLGEPVVPYPTPVAQAALDVTPIVIVYGTLRASGHNHGFLEESRCLGAARVAWTCRLLDLGGFPMAVKSGRLESVVVEAYEVVGADALRALDRLEGTPHMYERALVSVLVEGWPTLAWLYIANTRASSRDGHEEVPGGDWLLHAASRRDRRQHESDDASDDADSNPGCGAR